MEAILYFLTKTTTVVNGISSETAGTPIAIRGQLTMLSGDKKVVYTELLKKDVYSFTCYNNSVITESAKVTYGGRTLIVFSVTKNFDNSFTNKCKVILYAK